MLSPALTSTSPRSFLNCSRGMTASDFRPTFTIDHVVADADDEACEDHSGADSLVSDALFEELGKTFSHLVSIRTGHC